LKSGVLSEPSAHGVAGDAEVIVALARFLAADGEGAKLFVFISPEVVWFHAAP